MALFGPAGLADSFKTKGYKKSIQVADYLSEYGLTAFEYQAGRGVKIGTDAAKQLGGVLADKNIQVSIHAPYFISMSSVEEEKRLNSVNYILQSATALNAMGGRRVIFHSGSCGKITRREALDKAMNTMGLMMQAIDDNGLGHMTLCPETMGKVNQLGSLDEVLALCSVDKRILPCIDFGHLNARDGGIIKGKDDYLRIIDRMAEKLKDDRFMYFHSHFSKIEYTAGGEKRHLTFRDTVWGPEFEPLMDVVYENNLSPVFICESAGTQTEDARTMKLYYETKKCK
ncbi:MAG: TIM barrel protein [Oscillospiraceae bacterium]|nr:endonuclease IV [Oscillospiraceae bacterium]MBR6608883.1 TIM barrel protein [Oscillospiraceae bacterium]